jgi:hypothetical protein
MDLDGIKFDTFLETKRTMFMWPDSYNIVKSGLKALHYDCGIDGTGTETSDAQIGAGERCESDENSIRQFIDDKKDKKMRWPGMAQYKDGEQWLLRRWIEKFRNEALVVRKFLKKRMKWRRSKIYLPELDKGGVNEAELKGVAVDKIEGK